MTLYLRLIVGANVGENVGNNEGLRVGLYEYYKKMGHKLDLSAVF